MSRKKDADKRSLILSEAKRLFADKGYDGTSMGALAGRLGIPVGSLYTYFDSKEALLNTIIEEGWNEFSQYLEKRIKREPMSEPLSQLAFLVRGALPELFKDLDLIAILFAQADRTSGLKEKLDYLASLVAAIIMDCRREEGRAASMDRSVLKAGLSVMLMGSLESMRLIRRARIDVEAADVIAFLVSTVEGALGCSLPAVDEPAP